MFDAFQQTAARIFDTARQESRLIRNPDERRLRELALAEPEVRETKYGSLVAESEPMSRAAKFTKNNVDTQFGQTERELLSAAELALYRHELVSVDVQVGDGSEGITARLVVPKEFAHVAYAGQSLFPPTTSDDPTYQVLMFFDDHFDANRRKPLPEKEITIRLAFSPHGRAVKIVRNSNYFGEWKKGVFADEDYRVKQGGNAIFLHAGCRKDSLQTDEGPYETSCSLFVALSANGKTSTTCKVLARKGHERSWLIQDDGGTLGRDGSFRGFEASSLFVKTDGLSPSDQVEAYYGALKPGTFLENVHVDPDGSIDFFNLERTSNGRAVIRRDDFMHASRDINARRVNNLFLITRGPIIPAIARLTHEQAAAFMVLGQSMESSAGDPTQAGKLKNEFFYDPFVAGDRAEHANLFYDLLQANGDIQCYLLNTGYVGEGHQMQDIGLRDTVAILDTLLRGGAHRWELSDRTGLEIPLSIGGVDSILVHPEKLYTRQEFTQRQQRLDRQRAEFIEQFPGLDPAIRRVFLDETARPTKRAPAPQPVATVAGGEL